MVQSRNPTRNDRPAAPPAWALREDGSITIFAVFAFVVMLLVAGIAVDMMRYENERVRMQNTTDRAVIAATMLRENPANPTPAQIAQAYFDAEGLGAQLAGRITVTESAEQGRVVTLQPGGTMPTIFMRMMGVNDLAVATPARAIEALGGGALVEVVMVLDVTGSMGAMTGNGLTRIENLRSAAADLADTLLRGVPPGQVALTLVPYAEHVLPPAGFINHFVNLPATGGPCPDFTQWDTVTNSFQSQVLRRTCATNDWRTVRPYLHDADTAVAHINALQASGTTSIDLGVRFGAMFFDPTINPFIEQYISNGTINPAFSGRPFRWNQAGTVRAMVLMTDGENCCGARFPVNQQDTQTIATCDALKAQGVIIYAVAFEAPQRGINLMQACASSENHFFNTTGSQIADAFAGIGAHIQTQQLRLIR